MFRIVSTALAALILATPLAALSQELPSYAQSPQGGNSGDEQIRGRITDFDGAYQLTVSDERGFVDNVDLHPGTIINPTGLTLAPGMVVSILGYNSGSDFTANEVDTPYSYESGIPYYAGQRYDSYGPSIGLDFFFGNVGWWHGNDFRGGYTYNRGTRFYTDVRIGNAVRGNDGYRGNDSYRGNDDRSYRGGASVVTPRDNAPRYNAPSNNSNGNAARFDRQSAPNQPQVTQQRGYQGARQVGGSQEGARGATGRQSGGHEDGARGGERSGGGNDRGGDHGGHTH